MDGFSGALRISDLNDFISPSQECVKPVVVEKSERKAGKIQLESGQVYTETLPDNRVKRLERAKISLNDCLACSGCVTSAETVLINQQSHVELERILMEQSTLNPYQLVVASVSPQSRASLAAKYNLDLTTAASRIEAYLRHKGVHVVLDTTLSRHLSLIAMQNEFVERFREAQSSGRTNRLPLIASACPGWICYAEKSHGSYILPYISTVRSPQSIMGAVVKHFLAEQKNLQPSQVYHLAVMPCFDKKLEASRSDFFVPGTSVPEVDCVISTAELDLMIENDKLSLSDEIFCPKRDADIPQCLADPTLMVHSGGGSGGYAEQIFTHAAAELFGERVDPVKFTMCRNKDFNEAVLVRDGQVVLSVATAYGFRNIQTLVQKIKKGLCRYDFVEVMACPSGCLNGGGQIKTTDATENSAVLGKVTDLYQSASVIRPRESDAAEQLIRIWLGGVESPTAKSLLHTGYHEVAKTSFNLNVKW